MYTYMHVSRRTIYNNGYILEYQKGLELRRQSTVSAIENFTSAIFFEHLTKMAGEGLSCHGTSFLLNHPNAESINFSSWALEMSFEYERVSSFKNMPSRFQSAFAWRDLEAAQQFSRRYGDGTIYVVEPLSDVAILDMNLLSCHKYFGSAALNANAYWSGKQPLDEEYKPIYEVLMKLPVKVIDKVEVLP